MSRALAETCTAALRAGRAATRALMEDFRDMAMVTEGLRQRQPCGRAREGHRHRGRCGDLALHIHQNNFAVCVHSAQVLQASPQDANKTCL